MSEHLAGGLVSFEDFQGFCPDFNRDDFALLQPFLKERLYRADEVVVEEGTGLEVVGFLFAGELVMRKEGRFAGKNILIARLMAGSVFGEQTAIASGPAAVTITAVADCRAVVLARSDLDKVLLKSPATGLKLISILLQVSGVRQESLVSRITQIL